MKYSLQLVRSFVTSPNQRWVNHTFIVGHHNNSVKFIIIRVDPTLWPLGLLLLLLFLTLFLIFYQHYCIFHVCTMAINIIRKTWTELRMLSHPNHLPPRLFLADDKRGKIAQEKPPSHKYVTIHRKPNLKWCSWCRKSDTRNSAVWCSRCSLAHLAPRSPPRVWHYTRRCCCCCSPAALALPDLQPRDEANCGAKCVFRAEIGARILIPPASPSPMPPPPSPLYVKEFPAITGQECGCQGWESWFRLGELKTSAKLIRQLSFAQVSSSFYGYFTVWNHILYKHQSFYQLIKLTELLSKRYILITGKSLIP